VALFKSRAKRDDEAQGAGSALALWQLDQPSTPTNGERPPPAATPSAAQSSRARSEHVSESQPNKPAISEPRDRGLAEDGNYFAKVKKKVKKKGDDKIVCKKGKSPTITVS
jgi:hypothetical protein